MNSALWEAFTRKSKTCTIGDVEVPFREPSASDVTWAQEKDGAFFGSRIVVRCILGDGGERLYTDEHAARIHAEWSAHLLSQLALEIVGVSTAKGGAAPSENPSQETDGDTSPSGSPLPSESPTPTE